MVEETRTHLHPHAGGVVVERTRGGLTSGGGSKTRIERSDGKGRLVPTAREITTFADDTPPPGASPWVITPAANHIDVVASDPSWPAVFDSLADRLLGVLGGRPLMVIHVSSTSVPGLDAKPVIDVDLIVADPHEERTWLPALEKGGLVLTVREPWWHEHRLLHLDNPGRTSTCSARTLPSRGSIASSGII